MIALAILTLIGWIHISDDDAIEKVTIAYQPHPSQKVPIQLSLTHGIPIL